MMDCEQIKQLLDAYALGAADADETQAVEEHVADCVRCWSELDEAQRAAAAIALSTAVQEAPDALRRRVLADAERAEVDLVPRVKALLRRLWPVGAGAMAAGIAASLAFVAFVQAEVDDLRGDNSRLQADLVAAGEQLSQQREVMSVLAAPDTQQVTLQPTDPGSPAAGVFHWSGTSRSGALLCNNLPALPEGQVYTVWLLTDSGVQKVGTFTAWDGIGQLGVDMNAVQGRAVGIGMSVEESEDAQEPGEMFLYADFRRRE